MCELCTLFLIGTDAGREHRCINARTRLVLALSAKTDEQQISSASGRFSRTGKEIMANYPHANRFNLSLFDLRQ